MVFQVKKNAGSVIDIHDLDFRLAIITTIIQRLEDSDFVESKSEAQLRALVSSLIDDYLSIRNLKIENNNHKDILLQSILDDLIGFGPIQSLINDPKINDILVNLYDEVYVEIEGVLSLTSVKFNDNEHVLRILRRMLAPLGKRIDESSPMVDARLPDGSRLNAIIPPISLKGPALSIRKFNHLRLMQDDLLKNGTLPLELLTFLGEAVVSRRNIIISGGTGSGKTVLLNVLSNYISENERVVTIEDSAELQLKNAHVVSLETRPSNTEGVGEITQRMLVKNALRMRPDRIIVGESRGDEVLEVLQAMNTGHNGSMSTLHANSAKDALVRLEMMVRMSEFKGSDTLVNQIIATSIDMIIHTNRNSDGHRHVEQVILIKGLSQGRIAFDVVYQKNKVNLLKTHLSWKKNLENLLWES